MLREPFAQPALDGQHGARLGDRRGDGHHRRPLSQADSVTLVLFIVPALAAALFAGFRSLWIAVVAGFAIGIGQSLMTWVVTLSWFPRDKGNPMPAVRPCSPWCWSSPCRCAAGAPWTLVEKRLPFAPHVRGAWRSRRWR